MMILIQPINREKRRANLKECSKEGNQLILNRKMK